MTLRELSQLYWLKREIGFYEQELAKLEAEIGVSSPNYDGMPHAHDNGSITERQAIKLADLTKNLKRLRNRCVLEHDRLIRFISEIPDSHTRMIFICRFEKGMTWWEVADAIGGGNTADSARKACMRYLHKVNEDE